MLFLPACGFTPLYGGGAVSAHYAEIEIPSIPDRDGQALRNLLIDRLYTQGRPHDARYELRVTPPETDYAELGIQKDATITRVQIEITARMALFDRQAGAPALSRDIRAVGGYDVMDEQYATLVTRRAATERVLEELANAIQMELNLYFKTLPPQ